MIPPATLAGYTDAELTEFYSGAADGADEWRGILEAEMQRRDDAGRAPVTVTADVRAEVRAEWELAAHAQYLAAETACNGYLVRRPHHDYRESAGQPGKCADCGHAGDYPRHSGVDAFALWTGSEEFARAHSTDELRAFWDAHGRLTLTEYRRQQSGARHLWQDSRERAASAREEATVGIIGRAAEGMAREAVRGIARGQGTGPRPGPASQLAAEAQRRADARRHAAEAQRAVAAMPAAFAGDDTGHTQRASQGVVAVRSTGAVVSRQQPEQPPVDGAEILGYVRQFIDQFARMPSESAADVVALWIAHAHCRSAGGSLVFESTPRLMLLSQEPGSGKSRVLNLARLACGGRFGLLTEPTAWAIAHIVGPAHEGAFIDEGDVLFGKGSRKESVRAVLNSGYTRDGVIAHMRGKTTEALEVFGPVAVAGLDVMRTSTGASLEPLFTRSITVRMRKSPDPVPPIGRDARGKAALLHTALGMWAGQNRDQLGTEPDLPEWLANRDGEVWGPLVAVADAAERSHLALCQDEDCDHGQWPERILVAAAELCGAWEQPQDEGEDVMAGLAGVFAGPVAWDEEG